jgi:hypothetical protein
VCDDDADWRTAYTSIHIQELGSERGREGINEMMDGWRERGRGRKRREKREREKESRTSSDGDSARRDTWDRMMWHGRCLLDIYKYIYIYTYIHTYNTYIHINTYKYIYINIYI